MLIYIVLPDTAEEQTLLSKAARQDQEALRVIYQQYFPPIYQFIRLRIEDQHSAQDITAEVFLDFFKTLKKNRAPNISLRAWLFRVARNKIYDHYGKDKQFTTTQLDEWIPSPRETEPEMEFMRTFRISQMRKALQKLAVDQQEVILLRFSQGLNLQETADLMDKSVSAIKSLQFRAVETLRSFLIAQEVD